MATLAQKYAWLINTIRNHGSISLKDLKQKWQNSQLNHEQTIFDRSKLNRWRTGIEDQFGLKIDCEKGGEYRYYLSNPEVLEKNNINNPDSRGGIFRRYGRAGIGGGTPYDRG